MARNYKEAVKELEPVNSNSKGVRRKLIICYVQVNDTKKAVDAFYSLVKEDVQFIIDADPVFDDCPCSEIVSEFAKVGALSNSGNYNLSNGILWLYCDPNISIQFLQKAIIDLPENNKIKESLNIIESHIQK